MVGFLRRGPLPPAAEQHLPPSAEEQEGPPPPSNKSSPLLEWTAVAVPVRVVKMARGEMAWGKRYKCLGGVPIVGEGSSKMHPALSDPHVAESDFLVCANFSRRALARAEDREKREYWREVILVFLR